MTDHIKDKAGALMHSLKSCLESKQLPVLGLALKLSCSCFCSASGTGDLSHLKQLRALHPTPPSVPCRSCSLSQCPASPSLPGIPIPAPSVSVPRAGWRDWGIHFLSAPCEQNCAILWGIFAWGRVVLWNAGAFLGGNPLEFQWTKLRGKLEVPQDSVQIQLHTLKIEEEKKKGVWLCPKALTVYIVPWENQKIALQVVEPCDLANVCVWNPVYSAFQILTL